MSNKLKILQRVLLVTGLVLLCYPIVAGVAQHKYHNDAIATYQSGFEETSDEDKVKLKEDANHYNDMLFQSRGGIISDESSDILSDESYKNLLNVTRNGIMGIIEIPKIDVNLPIYHGTSDEVLSNGIGHQQGTSLPVGGENTNCVLTGHRGLPNSKLFTRLDELKKGDYFFIKSLDEVLAYKVNDIKVILPEEVEVLDIPQGKDMVSLITCTPYGINTHRLVVCGERVPYDEGIYKKIGKQLPSIREIVFTVLPFAIIIILIGIQVYDYWRKKHEKVKNVSDDSTNE